VRLLGGVLSLHDVEDVEKLAGKALADQTRKSGARLRPEQREDALRPAKTPSDSEGVIPPLSEVLGKKQGRPGGAR
jgi:hypothetical protein